MGLMKQIQNFEIAKMPIGTAAMLSVAMGLTDGIGNFVSALGSAFMPATFANFTGVASNVLIAYSVENIKAIRGFMGPDLADMVSIAAMMSGVNGTLALARLPGIQGTVSGLIGKATAMLPLPAARMISAPAPAAAATSGYAIGANVEEAGAPVDDVDMLLLANRGITVG
jgi:hypothetical protein